MNVDKEGTLKWSTKSETGKLSFAVEQFRWNKWVKVGEVDGNGSTEDNKYEFKITPHSGENKFRVKQVDYTKKARESKEARLLKSPVAEVFIANENLLKIDDIVYSDEIDTGEGSNNSFYGIGYSNGKFYINYEKEIFFIESIIKTTEK